MTLPHSASVTPLSPAITSSTIVDDHQYLFDSLNVPNGARAAGGTGASHYSSVNLTKESTRLPSSATAAAAAKTTGARNAMTLPTASTGTPLQGYRSSQQQLQQNNLQQYSHVSHYINTNSSDMSSSKSDYSLNTGDTSLYRASDRRRYIAATGLQPADWRTGVSRDTLTPSTGAGRIIPIDYSDVMSGMRSRSSSHTGKRSVTPGGRSSSAASGYHTGNFTTASSTTEQPIYVSTIEHHVKDYQIVDAKDYRENTRVHSSTSGYTPSVSTYAGDADDTVNNGYRVKSSLPSLPSTSADVCDTSHYSRVSREIVQREQEQQRQPYKLMSCTSSTTVTREDKKVFATELAAHLRRSMPNVNMHLNETDSVPVYPYCVLETRNYRFPPNVDRCHLEVSLMHLSV